MREGEEEVSYRVEFSTDFEETIKKKKFKRNSILKKAIQKTLEGLELNPYRKSKRLGGKYEGKRRIWVGSNYRVIFTICEECRKLEEEIKNDCSDCAEKSDNFILFCYIDKRRRVYNR